jgi:SAM-dependent methyltransferase
MNNVNYAAMSDRELKRYILTHRDDREGFYAYMDRQRSRPRKVTIKLDDPAWEEKIISEIRIKDMSLVRLLNPQQHEDILDLGCGDGKKTKEIADSGARVVGIDIWDSGEDSCNNLEFEIKNATDLDYNQEFDAVFSNLVIHHIKTPEQVISSVWNALKPGGRFVAEFYGHGTAEEIILALQEVMSSHNYSFDINEDFPWYLPTQEEYCNLLINQGFEVTDQSIFPVKMPFVDICSWLEQILFNTERFKHINKEAIFAEVQNQVRSQLFKNSTWFVNYQHIRIVARKSSQLSNNN